jgi:predicted nucleotidyltransferase
MIVGAGLSERDWALISSVFEKHPELDAVKLFGSRAKGTPSPSSDIDLALFGPFDALHAQSIQAELEELPLPYKFDVQHYPSIQHDALREHIDRVGITVCPAGSAS